MAEAGSIADVQGRLLLWAIQSPQGLARVEFASEFSQQMVVQFLRESLAQKNLLFHEITLPTLSDAEVVVGRLIDQLAVLPPGLVSINGFSTAFNNQMSLMESLRILNYNRERYLVSGLCQIWWMTPTFMQTAIHTMPDINSFFAMRLQLKESALPETTEMPMPFLEITPATYANMEDAHRRVNNLLQRFHHAQAANAPDDELLKTYLLPALESLVEVGAQQELRDLTLQFEGLLGQLKVGDSLEVADSLDRLGKLYHDQGRYSDAEPLYVRSLAIREKQLGEDHLDTAASINNLANLYKSTGRYVEAEPLYIRSLAINDKQLGAEHQETSTVLNNLALLYESMGRYIEAEPLYLRSLSVREKQLGDTHQETSTVLNNLALLYDTMGRYEEAETLYLRSLAIREKQLGEDHPETATSLNNIAGLYDTMGRYEEAETLYFRSLAIREKQLGEDHPETANSLNNLAGLYKSTGRYVQAEALYFKSLAINEKQLGTDHPDTAINLANLASLYFETGCYTNAMAYMDRALVIMENKLGKDHPNTRKVRENLERPRFSAG
jgi:tetratricopeptide (TPR) repeat protein